MKKNDLRKGYQFNAAVLNTARVLLGRPVLKATNAKMERYEPKHKTFILIANHSDPLDPGFEMVALGRYVRFIAGDQLVRASKAAKFALVTLGGSIVKYRNQPSSVLTEEILKNLKAGIPVGIHAEGGTSVNGETGYISEHTGQLVKDSGVALITFRFIGGYLRTPRWSSKSRKGPLYGSVVHEYSPEELQKLSVKEITDIIRRDTFVNVYDEQKKEMHEYSGTNLAEYVERTLYMCPKCKTVGKLHSSGDFLTCDACGYRVRFGADAFFHDTGSGLVFDNVCDWDKWQREEWKQRVLSVEECGLVFIEDGQKVYSVNGSERTLLCDNAVIELYTDKFVISMNGEKVEMMLSSMKSVQIASRDGLIMIDDDRYFDVRCDIPRAAAKYVAAWRYLIGKEYL